MNEEKMVPYSVRLKPDQVTFLRQISNASDFIRRLIDQAIIQDSTIILEENKVIALTRKISALELQISVLQSSPAYRNAKRKLKETEKSVAETNQILRLLNEPKKWVCRSLFDEDKKTMKQVFICIENPNLKIEIDSTDEDEVLGRFSQESSRQMKRLDDLRAEICYHNKIIEAYDESVRKINDEIEKFKKQVLL